MREISICRVGNTAHFISVGYVLRDSTVIERHIPSEHRMRPEVFGRDEEE